MNEWRKIFSIYDILNNYFISVDVFSLLLEQLLTKLHYMEQKNRREALLNTGDVYAILSDYFDLSLIGKGSESVTLKKKKKNRS